MFKTQRTNNAIEEVIKEASKLSKLHPAILFGSAARGDIDRFSDLDLLIICKDKFEIRKAIYDLDPPLDVSIYSPNELILMAGLGLPFIHHLAKEGIIILDDGTFKNVISNLRR